MENWYEEKDFLECEEEIPVKEYDITATPNDFNVQTLYSLIDHGVIQMPPFQRNYVWDIRRASKLIESIILGLPIPQLFLYEKGRNNFWVIDGQQRLLSIYFFMKQRFPTKRGRVCLRQYLAGDTQIDSSVLANDAYFSNFSLRLPAPVAHEKNKFNKLKYETLGEYKYTFEILRTIRSVVIKQNEPKDDSSIYEIFNRLNTGGQNLSTQEIRMSMYYSAFYRMIIELNEDARWRRILNQQFADGHFRDVEILIRCFAMLFHHETYSATISHFLNAFSKEAKLFSEGTLRYLRELFVSFLDAAQELDAADFKNKGGQFWVSLFESVFVAACHTFFQRREPVQGKISPRLVQQLKKDPAFVAATQRDITSKNNVATRMARAKELIALS
nr:DUF262 domain-containing protein [Maliibacterium massiliense]